MCLRFPPYIYWEGENLLSSLALQSPTKPCKDGSEHKFGLPDLGSDRLPYIAEECIQSGGPHWVGLETPAQFSLYIQETQSRIYICFRINILALIHKFERGALKSWYKVGQAPVHRYAGVPHAVLRNPTVILFWSVDR